MIPLEDALEDIIGKAQRGLGLSDAEIITRADVLTEDLVDLRNGLLRETALRRVCGVLQLHADSLLAIARSQWEPDIPIVPGLRQFRDEKDAMKPNAYLMADANGDAILVDTTTDARPIIEAVRKYGLRLGAICITHTHRDHVADLDRLRAEFPAAKVYASTIEPVDDAALVHEGAEIHVSDLMLEVRLTAGHSVGGLSYIVRQGLSRPVAVVGDALFAGSMGGGIVSWPAALANNRKKLFTLSDETAVCPGHGPMTTIGQEKEANPFYPEYKPVP